MSHFVLILLSKKNISLYYNADTSSSYLQRFNVSLSNSDYWSRLSDVDLKKNQADIEHVESEVDNFFDKATHYLNNAIKQVGSTYNSLLDKTLFCSVETYLRNFFLDVYRNENFVQFKAQLPVVFMFCSDVEYDERLRLINQFKDDGYGNVLNLDYESSVIDYLNEQKRLSLPYTCVLENDGIDVSLGLYITQTSERLDKSVIATLGQDPRVGYGVKLLWDSITARGLTIESEQPILSEIVKNFLANESKSLFNETIVLSDNREYDAYLLKNDINSAALANDQLGAQIRSFFKRNEAEPSKVHLIFREYSSKNNLLESSIAQSFSSVVKISDKLHADVLSKVWKSARLVDLNLEKMLPQSTANTDAIRTWVRNNENIVNVIGSAESLINDCKPIVMEGLDELRKSEDVWLQHMSCADFKGAKLCLQLNASSNYDSILDDLILKKDSLDNVFSVIQTISSVNDAKSVVERYNKSLTIIIDLLEHLDQIKNFVSTKLENTDKYEDLFAEYKKTLEELKKTSVRSQQERLIEKIKTLVPPGFSIPVIQTSKIKVKLSAEVITTGSFFSKKRKIRVKIDLGDSQVPYRCVLAFSTEPIVRVDRFKAFVDDLNEEGDILTGLIEREYDLPLKETDYCRKKGELIIKLWPHEDESVGINAAFEGNTCTCQQ